MDSTWAADNYCQHRSNAMGGDARWIAAAITTDGGGVTAMDGSSGNGQQWQCNRRQDNGVIAMDDETATG